MSSPYLNNLIIIGCMLTYSSVIFLGLDSTLTSVESFPYICTARAWLLMAGFSLAFGSMFSKTWRVHSIFTDVKLNKKVIKDYQLFMVVGVLLVIDLAIMTTWQVTDPFYRETKQMEPYPHPSSDDILIIPENEYCQSERMTIFVGSIYAYKGLLMIFGAFLAWETRHVSIPALNDSKYVGMSVYNVVIMCVMGAAISFVLSDKQDASFIIISVFIIFCTTGTLCLVFVPKLIELKRNPQGSIDKRIRATLRPMSKRRDSVASELEEKLRDAKAFNQKFRKELQEKEAELQMLVRRLGDEGRDILDSDFGMDRLAVPRHDALLKREAPSGTETTEVSSLCSLNSSQDGEYVNLTVETPGPRKKTTFASKPVTVTGQNGQQPGPTQPPVSRHREISTISSVAIDMSDNQSNRSVPSTERPQPNLVAHDEDSEPLINASTPMTTGESNVHFVPESVEEEDGCNVLAEEKSLIGELLEDRPRLPTPPPALTKVVSFGDVNNSPSSFTMSETILPPPKQFHPKHRHTASISMSSHSQLPPITTQQYTSHTQYSQPSKPAYPAQQHYPQQPPPSALRRRSSVRSTSSGGSAPHNIQVGASERRRTSVPAGSVLPYSGGNGGQQTVPYASENVMRNIKNNVFSEGVVPRYYSSESDKCDSKEYLRNQKHYQEDSAVMNLKTQSQTVGVQPTPFLLNGGDLLLSGNTSSPNVATRDHVPGVSEYMFGLPDAESECAAYDPPITSSQVWEWYNEHIGDNVSAMIQRSVSEKSRERSTMAHRVSYQYSNQYAPAELEAAAKRPPGDVRGSNVGTVTPIPPLKQQKSALSHVHSTPNVASIRGGPYSTISSYPRHGSKTASSSSVTNVSGMCSAVSEGELLDLAILPIFQKLLSERHKSRSGYGASIASCPNISIKCDIVEYL